MGTVQAVIGIGYGDEGKGAVTVQLCYDDGVSTVVRHSGGANAGHTVRVEAENGEVFSHVFHHFGSGALHKVKTYLGRRFISNPILFLKERKRLITVLRVLQQIRDEHFEEEAEEEEDIDIEVWADPRGLVTTPIDMILNEMREEKLQHGSTANGINETVERSLWPGGLITISTLNLSEKELDEIYKFLQRYWVPERMAALGLTPEDDPRRYEYLMSDTIRDNWIQDAKKFIGHVLMGYPNEVLDRHQNIVFEGSQGLLLDEKHGFFPHVTRARTGLVNVAEMLEEASLDLDVVHWVTRSYMTRHGKGPFPSESSPNMVTAAIVTPDMTNVTGKWQGPLRYGTLDYAAMKKAIEADLEESGYADSDDLTQNLNMTWLDGLDYDTGETLANAVAKSLKIPNTYYGAFGPNPDQFVIF